MKAKIISTETGLAIEGELNHQTVPALFKRPLFLARIQSSDTTDLKLDLSAVDKVDSAGVALLVHWTQLAKTSSTTLCIQNAKPQVRQIVDIFSLDSQLDFQ